MPQRSKGQLINIAAFRQMLQRIAVEQAAAIHRHHLDPTTTLELGQLARDGFQTQTQKFANVRPPHWQIELTDVFTIAIREGQQERRQFLIGRLRADCGEVRLRGALLAPHLAQEVGRQFRIAAAQIGHL